MFFADGADKICALYDRRPKIRPASQFETTLGWSKIFAGELTVY
jgi:hypothetical protein